MLTNQSHIETSFSCFNQLKKNILNGLYSPGEKLTISKIKKGHQWGQSPIREALSRLITKELVEFEENKGFRVSRISEAELRDLFQTIRQIESIAIRQSLEHGDDQCEVNLVASFHRISINENKGLSLATPDFLQNSNSEPGPLDYVFWVDCIFSFHRSLILGCKSPSLIRIHDLLFLKLERYVKLAFKYDPPHVQTCYDLKKRILETALRRDADETCRLFIEGLSTHTEGIVLSLKADFFKD